MKTFGIYEVIDEYDETGRWKGYRVSVGAVTVSEEKQGWGKLYPKSDGKEFYSDKDQSENEEGSSEDLEI